MTGVGSKTRAACWFAIGLACVAPAAVAQVDGVYKLADDSDCRRIGEEGGSIRIQDRVLYGINSQCRMLNPLPVRNMDAELVDMVCTGGGTEWTERAMVMRGATEELILVWNGYAFAYPRCPNVAPLPRSDVRPRKRPVSNLQAIRPRERPVQTATSGGG